MNLRFLLLSSCFLLPAFAYAQGIPSVGNGLSLTASSNNPSPGQQVTITAQSFSSDLNSATITWTVSGKRAQQGVGLTTLTISAPDLGKITTVSVAVVTSDGRQTSGSITVGSGSVDMIIESDGYVPPFFLGKLPLAYQNIAKITAVPHLADSTGKEYDPRTLLYQWKKDNGTVLQDQSGYGKQSISLPGDIVPRPYYLVVDIWPRSGSVKAEGVVQINPQGPSLDFYIDDPLYGPLYNKAVGGVVRIGSQRETGILAVPYGFNGSAADKSLSLAWLINGASHPELASSKSVILRTPGNAAGSSDVGLRISGDKNILQDAQGSFSAIFTATTSSAVPQATF